MNNNNILNNIDNINDPEFLLWLRKKIQENPTYSQYNINDLYQEYSNQNNDLQNNGQNQSQSKKRILSNGKKATPIGDNPNHFNMKNAAFTNWYGIILTLIFSFAIGYLIAWIIFNAR